MCQFTSLLTEHFDLFLRAVVNIPIQTQMQMTVIAQDDHLTAGAWAACVGASKNNRKRHTAFLCFRSFIEISATKYDNETISLIQDILSNKPWFPSVHPF